jgi:hypothetical protein
MKVNYLGHLGIDGKIIINITVVYQDPMAGYCEPDNETSCSIVSLTLGDYQFPSSILHLGVSY